MEDSKLCFRKICLAREREVLKRSFWKWSREIPWERWDQRREGSNETGYFWHWQIINWQLLALEAKMKGNDPPHHHHFLKYNLRSLKRAEMDAWNLCVEDGDVTTGALLRKENEMFDWLGGTVGHRAEWSHQAVRNVKGKRLWLKLQIYL